MFELYKDKRDEWRWRFRAINGKIVFVSSESYKNRKDAVSAIGIAKLTDEETKVKELK